jgi:hypothetical protein
MDAVDWRTCALPQVAREPVFLAVEARLFRARNMAAMTHVVAVLLEADAAIGHVQPAGLGSADLAVAPFKGDLMIEAPEPMIHFGLTVMRTVVRVGGSRRSAAQGESYADGGEKRFVEGHDVPNPDAPADNRPATI